MTKICKVLAYNSCHYVPCLLQRFDELSVLLQLALIKYISHNYYLINHYCPISHNYASH